MVPLSVVIPTFKNITTCKLELDVKNRVLIIKSYVYSKTKNGFEVKAIRNTHFQVNWQSFQKLLWQSLTAYDSYYIHSY